MQGHQSETVVGWLNCGHKFVSLAESTFIAENTEIRYILVCRDCRTMVIPGPAFDRTRWPVPDEVMDVYFGPSQWN